MSRPSAMRATTGDRAARLSPTNVCLLALALAIVVAQAIAFWRGLAVPRFEDGLIGIRLLFSTLPVHGKDGDPWVLLSFPVLCILSWELLETVRDRGRLLRLRKGIARPATIARSLGQRAIGMALAIVGGVLFNFGLGILAILLFAASNALFAPAEMGQAIFPVVVGIVYPLPLGFFAIWAYLSQVPKSPA